MTALETLPAELQRNFTLMRDLDVKTQGSDLSDDCLETLKTFLSSLTKNLVSQI